MGLGRGVRTLKYRRRPTRCSVPGLAPLGVVEIRLRTLYEARYMLDNMPGWSGGLV